VLEACRYYDAANFAARATCPMLVGVGLIDETCPPASVIAAFNQCRGPKELVILPRSAHQDRENSQAPYRDRAAAWRDALRTGPAPAPPKTP
jgi:cephalosporin-C deacetylase-like acetyl esterase